MDWQLIETFKEDAEGGPIVVWGKKYGYGDTPEQIEESEPEAFLLAYSYIDNGERCFASTETYYDGETYYVKASHWLVLPPTPTPSARDGE